MGFREENGGQDETFIRFWMDSRNTSTYLTQFRLLSEAEKQQVLQDLRNLGFSGDDLEILYDIPISSDADPSIRYMQYPEFRLHKLLLLYVPPFLLVLGTLGNLFSFFILRHKSMRQQSIYIYLSTLAVFDSFVLYIGLLRQWLGEVTGSDIRNGNSWLCKGIVTFGYSCSDISVWLIIAVTVERYIVVCHPLRAPRFCQELRAKKIVLSIVLVFVAINFHLFFSVDVQSRPSSKDGELGFKCGPLPGYEELVSLVWPWVDALLYGFGPFVLICVLNSIILVKICHANKSRAKLLNGHRPANRSSASSYPESNNIRMTIMLLSVSFTFLLTTLPMNVSNIVANIWINTPSCSDATRSKGILFGTLASLLMYLNHSANFVLYCATGRKFRDVVARIFWSKFRQRTVNALDHSQHLYCSRKCTVRYGVEQLRSSQSQESHL